MLPRGRRRGRLKLRWMDCVNRDMSAIWTTEDEVHDRTGWSKIVSAAGTRQLSGRGYKKKLTIKACHEDICKQNYLRVIFKQNFILCCTGNHYLHEISFSTAYNTVDRPDLHQVDLSASFSRLLT